MLDLSENRSQSSDSKVNHWLLTRLSHSADKAILVVSGGVVLSGRASIR